MQALKIRCQPPKAKRKRKLLLVEDEKMTLASQVSSLQTQLIAVQGRYENVAQTADNIRERERDVEDKLDRALSLHARQIDQRQTREGELERTVAHLASALAQSKREHQKLIAENTRREIQDPSTKSNLLSANEEIENLNDQLDLGRRQVETLQKELKSLSEEHAREEATHLARHRNHDAHVSELNVTITRLQQPLKIPAPHLHQDVDSTSTNELELQVRSLSEQLLKQQFKMDRSKSDISALRNRLKAESHRAELAEDALQDRPSQSTSYEASESELLGTTARRRVRKRVKKKVQQMKSIRSQLPLISNPNRLGEKPLKAERVGKFVDLLDRWSVETGRFLRINPLARGAFLLYLLGLHLWTISLLMFHAHTFEAEHGDFGFGSNHHVNIAQVVRGGGMALRGSLDHNNTDPQ